MVLQLVMIAVVVWPLEAWLWSWPGAALVLTGLLLGTWTLWVNRPGNFNIRPELKPTAKLILTGPYRWIRHPMYSALMLFVGGIAFLHAGVVQWLALPFLVAVLYAKTVFEERELRSRFPEYSIYARQAGRFLPRVILNSSDRHSPM